MSNDSRNPTPAIVDAQLLDDQYLVPPRTSVYSLEFNRLRDISLRWRYQTTGPWLTATEGESYIWCRGIQTGILFELSTPTGPNPEAIIHYDTSPDGMESLR